MLALPQQPDWSIGAGVTDDEKCARSQGVGLGGLILGVLTLHSHVAVPQRW